MKDHNLILLTLLLIYFFCLGNSHFLNRAQIGSVISNKELSHAARSGITLLSPLNEAGSGPLDVQHRRAVSNARCPPDNRPTNFSCSYWLQKGGILGESFGEWVGTGLIYIFDRVTFQVLQTLPVNDTWKIKLSPNRNGSVIWVDEFITPMQPSGYDTFIAELIPVQADQVTTCIKSFVRADIHGGDIDFEADLMFTSNIRTTVTNFPDGEAGYTCFYKYERDSKGRLAQVVVDCNFYPRFLTGDPDAPIYGNYHLQMQRVTFKGCKVDLEEELDI